MIRIEFLNLVRGNLNTRYVVTHRVTRATFPLSSIEIHKPQNDDGPWLLLHSPCVRGNEVKRVRIKSTRRSDQILKLTDYYILACG
jgi:hypothetical protein